MITVGAYDLSLTSTGCAALSKDSYRTWRIRPGKVLGHERIDLILTAVIAHAETCDLVTVEGPSYGSVHGSQHERGGLWWIVTRAFWQAGIPYQVLTPTQIKVYATGKGNAGKDDVIREITRRFPEFTGGNDEADALAAGAMVMDYLGLPPVFVPASHRAAIDRAEWCPGATRLAKTLEESWSS